MSLCHVAFIYGTDAPYRSTKRDAKKRFFSYISVCPVFIHMYSKTNLPTTEHFANIMNKDIREKVPACFPVNTLRGQIQMYSLYPTYSCKSVSGLWTRVVMKFPFMSLVVRFEMLSASHLTMQILLSFCLPFGADCTSCRTNVSYKMCMCRRRI